MHSSNPFTFIPVQSGRHQADAAATRIWNLYQELNQTQWLRPAAIEELQLTEVRLLARNCEQNVSYYRDTWARLGISAEGIRTMEDFRRLPILKRQKFQELSADFQATRLPMGTCRTGELSTSGTTGVPIVVLQTNVVSAWWHAFLLRDLMWCGLDPRGSLAVIRDLEGRGLSDVREGCSMRDWGGPITDLIETGACHLMHVAEDPRRQLNWLLRVEPEYLLSYPSTLDFLAGLVRERGLRLPKLRIIQAISEELSADAKRRIESAFGVSVKNTYTCQEAGYLASPCPAGWGFHVHAENVILEVLDDKDRPCRPGEWGRVVLTTLHNYLTPLIRYDIGDEVQVGPLRCPCGRGLPTLVAIAGKHRPMMHLPNGRKKSSVALITQFRKIGGFHQVQIIQQAVDRLIVKLVPDQSWSSEHPGRVKQLMHEFFEAEVEVAIEFLDRIELTERGKFQSIVSHLDSVQRG